MTAMTASVAKNGFQATSVSKVAALAHVARPAFYRVFPGGKDECFLATYEEAVDQLFTSATKSYAV